MTFTVEDGTGIEDANAYIDVDFFKAYHKERGNEIDGGSGDIQKAIIRATDFMEARWRWVGTQATPEQGLHWPALNAFYLDGRVAEEVPIEVKQSCADYALVELNTPNSLTVSSEYDASGSLITSKREKVGPIEEETEFGAGGIKQTFKKFPIPDRRLIRSGLVIAGGSLLRA